MEWWNSGDQQEYPGRMENNFKDRILGPQHLQGKQIEKMSGKKAKKAQLEL